MLKHQLNVDVIVLARYMQVLSHQLLESFDHDQIINIHHSFLPAFMGSRPHKRAHERGVKLVGATVSNWIHSVSPAYHHNFRCKGIRVLNNIFTYTTCHFCIFIINQLLIGTLCNRKTRRGTNNWSGRHWGYTSRWSTWLSAERAENRTHCLGQRFAGAFGR